MTVENIGKKNVSAMETRNESVFPMYKIARSRGNKKMSCVWNLLKQDFRNTARFNYSSSIAPVGQAAAQAPHSRQVSGSIS